MGNTISIKDKRVCVKPLCSRLEAIQKLKPITNQKGCQSFAGVVNFVSIFCPELQMLLKPIYKLTKKHRPFIWGDEQQRAFEEIKNRLLNLLVLSMPYKRGRFLLYSDTSKHATNSALYQVQNGKPKLIAYASKRMSGSARNYSITELELCGLAVNIVSFAHLLKRVDFDAVVNHLAITHIMKSKMEPATNRIKRLLEILSSYSFNLYYIKGKDMILNDFLSRQIEDDSNLHETIPISFNIWEILQENYHHLTTDTYNVQTRAQAKAQANATTILDTQPKMQEVTPEVARLPIRTEGKEKDFKALTSRITQQTPRSIVLPPEFVLPPIVVPPNDRPPPKPPNIDETNTDLHHGPDPRMDIEENSPHQEGNITESYVVTVQSYLEQPQELIKLVNTSKFRQRHLLQQADIDKILNVIKRKVLKGMHLPITIKEIQSGYWNSPFFKDLYRYLAQNIMPHKSHTKHKVEMLTESFILLGSLLLKLVTIPNKEKALLAIPENCVDKTIELYHSSLFVGHQGVIKTYLTISIKFFIPHLMNYLRSFLSTCHICQLFRNDKPPSRQL